MIELALTVFCIVLIIAVFYLLALVLKKGDEIDDLIFECVSAQKKINRLEDELNHILIWAHEIKFEHLEPSSTKIGRDVKKGTVINKEV